MKKVFQKIAHSKPLMQLLESLMDRQTVIYVTGIAGSLGNLIAAGVKENIKSSILLVTAGPAQAETALDDLHTILDPEKIGYLPPLQRFGSQNMNSASGPFNERMETLQKLSTRSHGVYVTHPAALFEKYPSRKGIRDKTLRLNINQIYARDKLLSDLINTGYRRESLVDSHGQFAVRGGIVDIFAFGQESPVRIEFDIDEIISMRRFDPADQRSRQNIRELVFLLGNETEESSSSIFDLLQEGSIVFWLGKQDITERFRQLKERYYDDINAYSPFKFTEDMEIEDIQGSRERFRQIIWEGMLPSHKTDIDFGAVHPDPFAAGLEELPGYISRYQNRGLSIFIQSDKQGEATRIEELLAEFQLDEVAVDTPTIKSGFASDKLGLALLTSHELFQRRILKARHTRFRRRAVQFDRTALQRGDIVVHTDYGIGVFEGLQAVKIRNHPTESLRIRYHDDVILYIPVENFGLVEKYSGSESAKPQLSRIGTREWIRTKSKTRKALQDIAGELLKLYALRKISPGYAYSPDTHWQAEMESSFEFEDTPDQITATADVKKDLEADYPMDRLICGDVGFGKTEVAVRAAFKIVQDSKQVAVLVPTTILAQQHFETFRSRLAPYPVRVNVLSRFKKPPEQKQIVSNLKTGKVDIIIGTHRLLSKDVEFLDLGMIIIDEEHRFGVKHKEKLKQMKNNVEVLTLTATPIPRTMHLALLGARDTSQINTPPVDRLPVLTEISAWSQDLIRDTILREVDRQGQVFFVHNRVQSIHAVKGMLQRLIPGVKFGVAHGQMPENELEKIMWEFLEHRFDVLITTMIIESGLDMPNVNTLIVNRADRLGLAQLYQLRGRIGRSNRQAYAYFLTPPGMSMTPEAKKRLSTLSELTELGSGLKVALRDLEIRGAGNLLGSQQSGYINAVGFDLYTKLLEETVANIKGEKDEKELAEAYDVKIEFDGPAVIPSEYIDSGDLRFEFYRRLAKAKSAEEVDAIAEELNDRFGEIPVETGNLCEISRLKTLCRKLPVKKLQVLPDSFIAELLLPENGDEAQSIVGRLVAAADPDKIEFRLRQQVDLIYRYKSQSPLTSSRKFLQRLTGKAILQD